MKIVGMMLTRNEDWVLGLSLRAALLYCDEIVIVDHNSTDQTQAIIDQVAREHPGRINLTVNKVSWWDEMDVRDAMLRRAREMGGTHLVIVDADEVLTGNLLPSARGLIEASPPGECLALPMVATYHSMYVRRIDWVWGIDSRLTWCFKDAPQLTWKPAGDGYQHHQRVPYGAPQRPELIVAGMNAGGVFHLQYITKRRLEEKAAYYKMMEVVRWPSRMSPAGLNQKYDWTLRTGLTGERTDTKIQTEPIPAEWWQAYAERGWLDDSHFRPMAESWQASEARRFYAHYGPEKFAGLELHGVV